MVDSGTPSTVRIALAGGGTGGHLFPGLALAGEIRALGVEVLGVGPGREIEKKSAPKWHPIASPRRPRSAGQFIRFPGRAAKAFLHSRKFLREQQIQAVVGLGGYGSLFPGLAAHSDGIPLYLLEQNAVPGRVTRLLARRARAVYSCWEPASLWLHTDARPLTLGNPIRSEALGWSREDANWKWGFRRDLRTLLIMGGSQGAEGLNRRILDCVQSTRAAEKYQVIHLTGPSLRGELQRAYGVAGIRARVLPFLDAIGSAYAAADLVLARAGGTTIAELAARGLPSVLVPYPWSADGHQEANARQMEAAGASWQVREEDLTPNTWFQLIRLLHDDEGRERLGRAAESRGRPDAGRRIAMDILGDMGVPEGATKPAETQSEIERGVTLPSPAQLQDAG
ncbi:MAG: UDP-N-acetylglucosamine--N-acetylmuramyl-(pentapeptide) pyrophosphoryl-undecaprenol N-acetylglucosamine transferase [Planctomycetota bacterium]|nr:UDP-N-acetylglucosamine--N-acetylmuramyl-(pentapeptide) pyrophosphoryl-undecaprenol N-acetylglucosamine transferase [Planctomycetota bacterium]